MVLFKYLWWWYYFILLFVASPQTWIWTWSIIGDLLILLQHAKCIASFIGIGSYVLTYGHDCTGTQLHTYDHGMQLHTLLGVQAGDICIAFIYIHEKYVIEGILSTLLWSSVLLAMFQIGRLLH